MIDANFQKRFNKGAGVVLLLIVWVITRQFIVECETWENLVTFLILLGYLIGASVLVFIAITFLFPKKGGNK